MAGVVMPQEPSHKQRGASVDELRDAVVHWREKRIEARQQHKQALAKAAEALGEMERAAMEQIYYQRRLEEAEKEARL